MIIRCLFCGCDSTNSKSVEHIIPESLGNTELVLPRGVVCDKCNNYFSREIENKVLSIQSFRDLCFYEAIPNKKGHLKETEFMLCGEECKVDWGIAGGKPALFLGVSPETIKKLFESKPELMISRGINLNDVEHSYDISRFLYKIAIEYYAFLLLQLEENSDADCFQFDKGAEQIIDFIRKGNSNKKYLTYEVEKEKNFVPFEDNGNITIGFFEKDGDLFFKIVLFGTRFTINLSKAVYN